MGSIKIFFFCCCVCDFTSLILLTSAFWSKATASAHWCRCSWYLTQSCRTCTASSRSRHRLLGDVWPLSTPAEGREEQRQPGDTRRLDPVTCSCDKQHQHEEEPTAARGRPRFPTCLQWPQPWLQLLDWSGSTWWVQVETPLLAAVTFEQRLEGGYFLQLYHVRVVVDVSHGLGSWSHHHNVIHLSLLAGRGWHHCRNNSGDISR